MIPPPLPARAAIDYRIFYGQARGGIRLAGPKVLVERIENAHQQARAWMAEHPELEILSITPGSGSIGDVSNAVFVTVWFRPNS